MSNAKGEKRDRKNMIDIKASLTVFEAAFSILEILILSFDNFCDRQLFFIIDTIKNDT